MATTRQCLLNQFADLSVCANQNNFRENSILSSVGCTCYTIVSVSQRADPIFQALYLHHHQVGVISGVGHRSHTLKSTEEMRGKFSCIRFMSGRPELLLEPAHWLGEECRGFLCESAALLVQLGTQAAQRTSPTRKLLPVPMNAFHKSKQPLLPRTQPVQLLPEFSKLRQAPLHHGCAN